MKKIFLFLFAITMQTTLYAKSYFPEGTRWTEIRLDTLMYDDWYSKVDGEWVPNFETIEYRVQGEYVDKDGDAYRCVYTNGPEWTDSLTFLISEKNEYVLASVLIHNFGGSTYVMWPADTYQFEWSIGKGLYYRDIRESSSTGAYPIIFFYGIIDEIKEGFFGGVRPLKYVDLDGKAPDKSNANWYYGYTDTNGGRIIQGIGVTEWKSGECLFGPPDLYDALLEFSGNWELYSDERHYRSMLVHFERDNEVLYDVWPEKEATIEEHVTYTKDQMATIILPTAPDASKGKYYRLDRCEKVEGQTGRQIVFEEEAQPLARVPYIIVPSEDFSIDPSALDLEGLSSDTVSIDGIRFIGSYVGKELPDLTGASSYIDIIDTTPDCCPSPSGETGKGAVIGALRAYLVVNWDDPYDQGGTRGLDDKWPVVLHDNGTGIGAIEDEQLKIINEGNRIIFDLQGRKVANGRQPRGVYIEDGKKIVK